MDNSEKIIQAATDLIVQSGERVEEITVRDVCKRAGVGLGLVNYYFGSKEALIEACVERFVRKIVRRFEEMRTQTAEKDPFERLVLLGDLTLSFLFEHAEISKISILSDMRSPDAGDNTCNTCRAYLPLVSACRPDLPQDEIERRTFCLIAAMQSAFLRSGILLRETGTDLTHPEERKAWYRKTLEELIGRVRE